MKQVKIKGKIALYKEFETDIYFNRLLFLDRWLKMKNYVWWGSVIRTFFKFEKITQFLYDLYVEKTRKPFRKKRFRYRIDIIEQPKRRVVRNWFKLSFKRVRLYYIYLSLSHFEKFDKEARRKSGYILSHLIMLLEFRICVFIYKLSYIENIYEAENFLKLKVLLIEDSLIKNVNQRIWVGQTLRFRNMKKAVIFKHMFFKRLKAGLVFSATPRYVSMNYKLMLCYIARYPEFKDIFYPLTQLDHIRRYIRTRDPVKVSSYGFGAGLGFSSNSVYRTGWTPHIGVDVRRLMENQGKLNL